MNTSLSRRRVIAQSLTAAVLMAAPGLPPLLAADSLLVRNVTQLYSVRVVRIASPHTAADVVKALAAWPGKVAVGGGRYSMDGPVAVAGGLHIDMRGMNKLVWLRAAQRQVRPSWSRACAASGLPPWDCHVAESVSSACHRDW